MANLNVIRIDDAIQVANCLHIAVVSILSGTDPDQGISRLDHITCGVWLLLGFNVSNGGPLGGNLLRFPARLDFRCLQVRVQGFLPLAGSLLST